jgi:protein-disulfide isomerase
MILLPIVVLAVCRGIASDVRAAETCARGKESAPIRMEIFSDFQCPACRAFYMETVRSVFTEYADTGKVCVVYREFPLEIHAHARQAARYGHAALRLGSRQWSQVADALFVSQDQWSQNGDLESVVSKVLSKSDLDALHAQLKDPLLDSAIDQDIRLGLDRDVNSTPTFFVTADGETEGVAAAVRYPILKRYLDSRLPK